MVTFTISLWSPESYSLRSERTSRKGVGARALGRVHAGHVGRRGLSGRVLSLHRGRGQPALHRLPAGGRIRSRRIRPGHSVRLEQNRGAALLGHLPPAAGTAGPPSRPGHVLRARRRRSCPGKARTGGGTRSRRPAGRPGRPVHPGYRRLWDEFTSLTPLPEAVRNLFEGTERVLGRTAGLTLLNAWDRQGRLAACMLLDFAPRRFASYLIGAHAHAADMPHASDLLMREMIGLARRGRQGVSAPRPGGERRHPPLQDQVGGASVPLLRARGLEGDGRPRAAARAAAGARGPAFGLHDRPGAGSAAPPATLRHALGSRERRASLLAGRNRALLLCSFETSFRELFERVDTVLFEGPLDQASLDRVAKVGRSPAARQPPG